MSLTIDEALKSGAKKIKDADREIELRSVEDLIKAKKALAKKRGLKVIKVNMERRI